MTSKSKASGNLKMYKVLAVRTLRGFAIGGLAQISLVLTSEGFNVKSLADLETLGFIITGAFVTGGLFGLNKLYRWDDEA